VSHVVCGCRIALRRLFGSSEMSAPKCGTLGRAQASASADVGCQKEAFSSI
jgi:hypothetical protein